MIDKQHIAREGQIGFADDPNIDNKPVGQDNNQRYGQNRCNDPDTVRKRREQQQREHG